MGMRVGVVRWLPDLARCTPSCQKALMWGATWAVTLCWERKWRRCWPQPCLPQPEAVAWITDTSSMGLVQSRASQLSARSVVTVNAKIDWLWQQYKCDMKKILNYLTVTGRTVCFSFTKPQTLKYFCTLKYYLFDGIWTRIGFAFI